MTHPLPEDTACRTADQRIAALQNWADDPNAYASLQPDLLYFDHPHGYIAFRRVLSGYVVLGNPIAEAGYKEPLLTAFLQSFPRSVFAYVSEETAQLLTRLNTKPMRSVHLGVERWIPLNTPQQWSQPVASAIKKGEKAGLLLKEQKWSEMAPEYLGHIRALNEAFVARSPAHKEIGFISRAMSFADEPGVRVFSIFTAQAAMPVGFCVLDPWYENGRCTGYQLHQFRLGPTKLWGVYFSVVASLVRLLQSEGYTRLSLGGCTTADVQLPSTSVRISKTYDAARKAAMRVANHYHPMTNLSQNKFQFAGPDIYRYLIAPHRMPLLPLLRFARANNMPFFPKG